MFFLHYPKPLGWLLLTCILACTSSCAGPVQESERRTPTSTQWSSPTATPETTSEESRIQRRISLPSEAGLVAFGDQTVWVSMPAAKQVIGIDVGTGQARGSPINLNFEPRQIAYGEGAIWVLSGDNFILARIDPLANEVIAEIDLSSLQIPEYNLVLLAAGEGAIWITDQTAVIQIDPNTNQLVGEPLITGEEIITAAVGHGTFWTGSHDDGIIARVDPITHKVVATIDMGFSVHGLAVDEESAWVLDEHGFAVVRIDPQTNQLLERIPIDFVGANLAAGAGSVWVAPAARDNGRFTGNDGIACISADDKQLLETIHVGGVPDSEYYAVYFADGSVWVLIVTPQMSVVQIAP